MYGLRLFLKSWYHLMKINLYQRQHPLNLTHGARPYVHQNPYSMTSSNSSIDFTHQANSMYQIAICEEPLYIIKTSPTTSLDEKPTKIRLRIDKGTLQYTDVWNRILILSYSDLLRLVWWWYKVGFALWPQLWKSLCTKMFRLENQCFPN